MNFLRLGFKIYSLVLFGHCNIVAFFDWDAFFIFPNKLRSHRPLLCIALTGISTPSSKRARELIPGPAVFGLHSALQARGFGFLFPQFRIDDHQCRRLVRCEFHSAQQIGRLMFRQPLLIDHSLEKHR